MLLAGDIGGTNTRLALFEDDGATMVAQDVFPSAGHKSLSSAIDSFLAAAKGKRPHLKGATFGIAGPVIDGRCKATNLPWMLDARTLAKKLGIARVTLLNDLVALGLGAIGAKKKELHLLHGPRLPKVGGGNIAVIGAGTGLGEAALIWDGQRLVPCGTEGGHSDFAPRNEIEWELREFMARKIGGRVSCERVLSGPGLGHIYDFLREEKGVSEGVDASQRLADAKDRNVVIGELGAGTTSEACTRALEIFAGIYGAEAGNLALKFLAVGGVYVTGNIAATLIPVLDREFIPAFLDKGRFAPVLDKVPVAIVKNSSIGLYGSARHAAGLV